MPLLDLRPPALNVAFRPGNTLTIDLTWPTGYLAGRTFTAAAGGETPSLDIAGDVMTLGLTNAQTTALALEDHIAFVLTDTTDAPGDVVIIGSWSPSERANLVASATVTVNTSTGAVTVTGAGAGGGARLGVVEHLWSQDGWGPFTEVVATNDAPVTFVTSVPSGDDQEPRGRFTASGGTSSDGNHRVWYLRDDTEWEDSEIRSVLHRPSAWGSSPVNRPQMGHVHRAIQVDETTWRAWVAWYDIAFGTSGLLLNTWLVDGVTLTQGSGGTTTVSAGPSMDPGVSSVDRQARIYASARIDAFDVAVHRVTDPDPELASFLPGDVVDISDGGIAAFNGNGKVVQGTSAGVVQLVDTTAGDLAMAFNAATITPSGTNNRYFPRRFASRLVGDRLMVKHWRLTDPEPDWDDLHAGAYTLTPPTAPLPLPAGRGLCGLIAGHAHSASYGEFGDITFRELAA